MKPIILFRTHSPRQKQLRQYLKKHWGVLPSQITWYEKALRHKSVIGTGKFHHLDCNERLELLGDAVLDTVVTEFLFHRFPDADEGHLTKVRARIVNRQTLGEVGMNAKLDSVIEARVGSDDSIDKIVGNALEAWLGAIYMDKGFRVAKKSIDGYLLQQYVNLEEILHTAVDFKSKLIEWSQQSKVGLRFETFSSSNGSNHFQCNIKVGNELVATAEEKSKKKAEQLASRIACNQLDL